MEPERLVLIGLIGCGTAIGTGLWGRGVIEIGPPAAANDGMDDEAIGAMGANACPAETTSSPPTVLAEMFTDGGAADIDAACSL